MTSLLKPRMKKAEESGSPDTFLDQITSIETYYSIDINGNWADLPNDHKTIAEIVNDYYYYLSDKEFIEKYKDEPWMEDFDTYFNGLEEDDFDENGNLGSSVGYYDIIQTYHVKFNDGSELFADVSLVHDDADVTTDIREENEDSLATQFENADWNTDWFDMHITKTAGRKHASQKELIHPKSVLASELRKEAYDNDAETEFPELADCHQTTIDEMKELGGGDFVKVDWIGTGWGGRVLDIEFTSGQTWLFFEDEDVLEEYYKSATGRSYMPSASHYEHNRMVEIGSYDGVEHYLEDYWIGTRTS